MNSPAIRLGFSEMEREREGGNQMSSLSVESEVVESGRIYDVVELDFTLGKVHIRRRLQHRQIPTDHLFLSLSTFSFYGGFRR